MSQFSETLMDHFTSPRNRGSLAGADLVGRGDLGGYPPFVMIYLILNREGDHVARAAFEAEGCGVTVACGSALTEIVPQRDRQECLKVTADMLWEALDGMPSGKEYCAHVAVSALRDAVRSWP